MSRWRDFSTDELRTIRDVLDDYCDRYEDTCEEQETLANEIYDELDRREPVV